ncbi:hypothetical protein QOZ80_7BG0594140 [Eleusine coracana subsp. coracana]|nr:hypothetical protein QOZ80_7BG0594140 [Eleusine coracana subsp. coracana]
MTESPSSPSPAVRLRSWCLASSRLGSPTLPPPVLVSVGILQHEWWTQVEHNGNALLGVPFTDLHEDPFVHKAAHIYTPEIFDKVKVQIERLSELEVTEVSWGENDSMRFKVVSKELDRVTNTHVWSDQMDHFHGLRNKGHRALLKASSSVEEAVQVMEFFDAILDRDEDEQSTKGTSFGPLPAHFSGAHRPSNGTRVLNPKKKISKGAPRTNRRLRSFRERMQKERMSRG